jgi:hypothetical protein
MHGLDYGSIKAMMAACNRDRCRLTGVVHQFSFLAVFLYLNQPIIFWGSEFLSKQRGQKQTG